MEENEKITLVVLQNNNFEIVQDNKNANVSAYCYECRKETNHNVITGFEERHEQKFPPYGSIYSCETYEIIQCNACNGISYKNTFWDSESDCVCDPFCKLESYVYPLIGQYLRMNRRFVKSDEFPTQEMCDIFCETEMAIHQGLPVLAGVGLRTLLEQVCNHLISGEEKRIGKRLKQTAKGGKKEVFILKLPLISKIKWLQKRKIIDCTFRTIFNNIRDIGNTSTHKAKLKENYDMASLKSGLEIIRNFIKHHYDSVNQAKEGGLLVNDD